jgi:hypothetical protein
LTGGAHQLSHLRDENSQKNSTLSVQKSEKKKHIIGRKLLAINRSNNKNI